MSAETDAQAKVMAMALQKQNAQTVTYGQLIQVKDEIKSEVNKLDSQLQGLLIAKAGQELDEFTKKLIASAIEKGIIKYDVRIKDLEKTIEGFSESIQDEVIERFGETMSENIYELIPGYQQIEESVQTMTTQIDEILANSQ